MRFAEILSAFATVLCVSSSGRPFPLCGLKSTCEPCIVPDCQDVSAVVVLTAVTNGQTILDSDDEILSTPSWTRESLQAERWVAGPLTDASIAICSGCLTTSRAARAVSNEYIALGDHLLVNTTFLTSIARGLFTEADVAPNKLVKMDTDADVIAKNLQIERNLAPKTAQRDELHGGLACLAPGEDCSSDYDRCCSGMCTMNKTEATLSCQ